MLTSSTVTLGVALGLLAGKPIGIMLACWLAVRLRLAEMPDGVSWNQLAGVGILCGIGFTMSLFIATLAFDGIPDLLDQAKIGVLGGSILAGCLGGMLLVRTARTP
jgi:NhaA family Na+:H+ antiporter